MHISKERIFTEIKETLSLTFAIAGGATLSLIVMMILVKPFLNPSCIGGSGYTESRPSIQTHEI